MSALLPRFVLCSVFLHSINGVAWLATPHETTTNIMALLTKGEDITYGENVTQLLHSLQAAALAQAENQDDQEMVVAALLHDVGHLVGEFEGVEQMGDFGSVGHETIGARMLEEWGCSPRVVAMVAGHVDAKRYRLFKDPDYYNQLSDASKETLKHQGGVMTAEQAAAFEAQPYSADTVTLRRYDDTAKVVGRHVQVLGVYQDVVLKHLETQRSQETK